MRSVHALAIVFIGLTTALLPGAGLTPTAPEETYKLGPGDQITIRASNAPEITDKPMRLDPNGYLDMPLVGRVRASGMTVQDLDAELVKRLKVYLEKPDVTVTVTEYQSEPVSVLGEVGTPGVHQLQGRQTLVEMLATAGGTRPDAGPTLRITRDIEYGAVPLPGAKTDATGKYSVAEVSLKSLIAGQAPQDNIAIKPYDVISVPRAELIYIAGDVTRSGPLTLTDNSSMTIVEALSSVGGVTKTADSKKARILRPIAGSTKRAELPVDVAKILKGKADDVPLIAGDILVIPSSNAKKASIRALEAAIQMGTVLLTTGVATGAL